MAPRFDQRVTDSILFCIYLPQNLNHMKLRILVLITIVGMISCKEKSSSEETYASGASYTTELHYPEEVHLKNIRQLTFGGDNAEAYWSFDNKHLVFQCLTEQ